MDDCVNGREFSLNVSDYQPRSPLEMCHCFGMGMKGDL